MIPPLQSVRLARSIIFAVFICLVSGNVQWWLTTIGCPEPWPFVIALLVTVPAALGGSRYVDMPVPCEHDWKVVFDWTGDPGVIGGTQDFSYRECRLCGEQDHETTIEPRDEQPEDGR